jgi:hypothetical protein
VKIEIRYQDEQRVDVSTDDLAEELGTDCSDDDIRTAIRESIDSVVTDQPWPSYTVDVADLDAAVARVRRALGERG